MGKTILAAVLLTALGAAPAFAQSAAVVEGVQMPAWVERGGVRQPVGAGAELREGDTLVTGGNARLLLRLAEGSQVKLGENASFSMEKLGARQENKQTFLQGAFNVARGAFRFTTDAKAKLSSRREVDIRVATVTAGIRGTDLWGASRADRDIVCLIEGAISVQRESDAPVAMNQALQFYIAPKTSDGKADRSKPEPALAAINPAQLQQWALETEIATGQGAARKGGKWKVIAAAHDNQGDALKAYDSLRLAGYAAEIFPTGTPAKRSYEVRLMNLPSKAEAEALAGKVDLITLGKARVAA